METHCRCSRRTLLTAGAGLLAAGSALGVPARAVNRTAEVRAESGARVLPSPIKEIDKLGHHNVPPGPYTEPSEILNFRGISAWRSLSGPPRTIMAGL